MHMRLPADWRDNASYHLLFVLLLALRFVFPFFHSPFDYNVSDMSRHWAESVSLTHPDFWASSDPKLYQVWLHILRLFTQDNHFLITFFTSLLCMSMALFWYFACVEIFPRRQALKLACLIALCPSTFFIYGYFMNETLMLSMIALGVWLTFRAIRRQTFKGAFWAGFCLILTLFARPNAIPIALLCMGWLCWHFPRRAALLAALLPVFLLGTWAAAWHSYQGLRIYAPFQFSGVGQVDYYASAENEHLLLSGHDVVIGAPVMRDDPFWPFFRFHWRQRALDAYFIIDPAHGWADWQKAIDQARASWTAGDYIYYRAANFLLFFAGPSWPDGISRPMSIIHGADKTTVDALTLLNSLARWLWPVLIVILCFYGPRTRAPRHETFLLLVAFIMCVLMGTMSPAIFDGRFRKALEPFLIMGAWIICHRHGRAPEKEDVTLLQLPLKMLYAIRFR